MTTKISEFTSISLRETIEFGKASIRTCIILNGGAAVALLAFAGDSKSGLRVAVAGIPFFAFGLLCAALASGAGYFAQTLTSHTGIDLDHAAIAERSMQERLLERVGLRGPKENRLRKFAIGLVVLALASFSVGSFLSWRVLYQANAVQNDLPAAVNGG